MSRSLVSPYRRKLVRLPPNRVWRSYRGGKTLETLAGVSDASDGSFPEDWIASTTRAVNIGREATLEGLSHVTIDEQTYSLVELVKADPDYFLGPAHVAKFGPDLRLLVKFLDPSIRLHFQVHPTAAFAQRFLGSPSGKTEAYHVLSTRPEIAEPYIYLGFQRPPSRDALRAMIERQDIAEIEACFDKVSVKPGDTYIVPGGVPHALGEGVFLLEIQEPSDLVVRFEFERGGYVLPESARFMNRGLDFCLDIFDLTPRSLADIRRHHHCPPQRLETLGASSWRELSIGPAQTACFRVTKSFLDEAVRTESDRPYIAIVTAGEVTAHAAGGHCRLKRYDKVFVPAGLGPLHLTPEPHAEILECHPPS